MEVVEEANQPNETSETHSTAQASDTKDVQGTEESDTPVLEIREPTTRPVYKLSVRLIDTYKHINKVYYEAKAKRIRDMQSGTRGGVYNDGYDDQNYDYIIHGDEIFAERYILKHRIGKGSFGQVVCAYDRQTQSDVAIKIIKSKHAFMVQARTEIRLLELALEKDRADDQNIVRLLDTFVYRKHQCLVFEMLSYNLYELLKNTRFKGVSLALVRKFAKQILRGLDFLAREDVDIIHCDLKPENILLRHPKRSAIKIIDFGSSCLSTKKTYTYIQSRFYRSPEVLLGLPYNQKIDMWSLGCVLVEMHTGEPLFGGVDQLDQLNRIVSVLGMVPPEMVASSPVDTRNIFFDRLDLPVPPASETMATGNAADSAPSTAYAIPPHPDRIVTVPDTGTGGPVRLALKMHKSESEGGRRREHHKKRTLEEIIGSAQGRRKDDPGHSSEMYAFFVDFIRSMLIYQPSARVSAAEALQHPFLHVNIYAVPADSAQTTTAATESNPPAASAADEGQPAPVQRNEEESKASTVRSSTNRRR